MLLNKINKTFKYQKKISKIYNKYNKIINRNISQNLIIRKYSIKNILLSKSDYEIDYNVSDFEGITRKKSNKRNEKLEVDDEDGIDTENDIDDILKNLKDIDILKDDDILLKDDENDIVLNQKDGIVEDGTIENKNEDEKNEELSNEEIIISENDVTLDELFSDNDVNLLENFNMNLGYFKNEVKVEKKPEKKPEVKKVVVDGVNDDFDKTNITVDLSENVIFNDFENLRIIRNVYKIIFNSMIKKKKNYFHIL